MPLFNNLNAILGGVNTLLERTLAQPARPRIQMIPVNDVGMRLNTFVQTLASSAPPYPGQTEPSRLTQQQQTALHSRFLYDIASIGTDIDIRCADPGKYVTWTDNRQHLVSLLKYGPEHPYPAINLSLAQRPDGSLEAQTWLVRNMATPVIRGPVCPEWPTGAPNELAGSHALEQFILDRFGLQPTKPATVERVNAWFDTMNYRVALAARTNPPKPGEVSMRLTNGAFISHDTFKQVCPDPMEQDRFTALTAKVDLAWGHGLTGMLDSNPETIKEACDHWNDPKHWQDAASHAQLYDAPGDGAIDANIGTLAKADVDNLIMVWGNRRDEVCPGETPTAIADHILGFNRIDPVEQPAWEAALARRVAPTALLVRDHPVPSSAFAAVTLRSKAPEDTSAPAPAPRPTTQEQANPAPSKQTDQTTREQADTTPQETTGPAPQETTGPAPQETTGPAPQETTRPAPQETTGPAPQEQANPTPTETESYPDPVNADPYANPVDQTPDPNAAGQQPHEPTAQSGPTVG
ncbi:hypothetical protein [Bifidobacterium rousetti]|uniref:hypothetical protein n=1 Tax=Bifidobacterium rousetti TaxID=2045439 RepID=UPI00123C5579|nr:hypothetical protein [Bifidobacterium rousetti]